jgi:hypothetical protein
VVAEIRIRPEDLRFAGRLAVAFLLLLALWWVVRGAWGAGFRALGNALAWITGASQRVEFRVFTPAPGTLSIADTTVWLLGPDRATGMTFEIPSLRYSYVPMGVYASLAFAAHRRPGGMGSRGFFSGLLVVAAYLVFSVTVTVARMNGSAPSLPVELAYRVLVNPPAFEYVVPAFVWLVAQALGTRTLRSRSGSGNQYSSNARKVGRTRRPAPRSRHP